MIVVDANVVLRGLRSRNGASHLILRSMIAGEVAFALSPAIVVEYEDVMKRPGILGEKSELGLREIDIVLDALCARCAPVMPWFRFRPFLEDPKDDLYVECALAAGAAAIVTDDRHFRHPAMKAFGVDVFTAREFDLSAWIERKTA